jgi:hypothetical protein
MASSIMLNIKSRAALPVARPPIQWIETSATAVAVAAYYGMGTSVSCRQQVFTNALPWDVAGASVWWLFGLCGTAGGKYMYSGAVG